MALGRKFGGARLGFGVQSQSAGSEGFIWGLVSTVQGLAHGTRSSTSR